MHEWQELFKITVALLAIVNTFGGIPIFISATHGWGPRERTRTARTVAVTVASVLALAAFTGDLLLSFFNISIGSFMVGGGILVFTRLMELILAAMAVEIIAHGLMELFPGLAS
jgi:multiple antibiotic resistance protein